jgi:hypothetical protein
MTLKLYKLTDQNCETRNHTKWGEGVTHHANGAGDLCGPGWLHAYEDPLIAVLLNPIHAAIHDPIMWEAEGSGEVRCDGHLKLGVTSLTTVRRIDPPIVTTEQMVEFAIRCGFEVSTSLHWRGWALRWLDGTNRSEAAAAEAAEEARAEAVAARAEWPAWSAWSARAARAAAAAEAAEVAAAAARAAEAASAARAAARAAAWAAARAAARAAAAAEAEVAAAAVRAAAARAAEAASAARAAAALAAEADPTLDIAAIAHRVIG